MRRLVIVAVTLGLFAISCSDGDNDAAATSPAEMVAVKAPDQTAGAQSAKTTFTISGVGPGAGAEVSADGVFDLGQGKGVIMTDLPSVAGVPLGKAEAVVDGGALYLKVPDLLADQVGKKWVKLDVGEVSDKLAGIDLSGLARAGTGNPTYALDNLRGATDVTVVGEERVRGDKTTHYRAVIDINKAIDAAPADQQEALRKANEFLGNQTIPADIWLDTEGRLRKLVYTVDPSKSGAPGASEAGKPTFTYELYEFGTPVNADTPSKDETVDLADVLPG